MNRFVTLERFSKTVGDVNLSKAVFQSLGDHAVDNVRHVLELTKRQGINVLDGCLVTLKNNKVYYEFTAEIDDGVDETQVRNSIEDIVTTNLLMICDVIPFEISTKIIKKSK